MSGMMNYVVQTMLFIYVVWMMNHGMIVMNMGNF